jgi:hypothetical protein
MKSLFNGVVGVFLVLFLAHQANASRLSAAQRIGSQKITTFSVLDHLKDARVKSPFVPSKKALFHKVHVTNKLMGTTHQNPWGGDGKYANMHVRVRKQNTPRIEHQLQDCLVLPLPAQVDFDVTILADSELRFAPEYVRLGNARDATLTVVVVDNGKEHVLYKEKHSSKSLYRNSWKEKSASLAAFSGRRVQLRFRVEREQWGSKQ